MLQVGIALRLTGNQRNGQTQKKNDNHNGGSTHPVIIVGTHPEMADTTQLRKLTAHVKAAG